MGMGFAPTWLRQVSPLPLLHMTALTTGYLSDDAFPLQFLMSTQQNQADENVGRHHVQMTEELREQLSDLRK